MNSPRALKIAAVAVPLGFGVWSCVLGQDANWDLQNYHLYNAFAFLGGKLGIDFAPAGLQTFFNPILDIPYFVASAHLPAPLVAFLMGTLHGMNFIVLLYICRTVLGSLPPGDRHRIPLALALAGCLTGNFLSELGNTMGDNTTALLVLASIAIFVRTWPARETSATPVALLVASGFTVGLAAGLKLTNATYAVAIGMAFLMAPAKAALIARFIPPFALGGLAGLALADGFWLYRMWETFGNPLFPQFGRFFPNSLAADIMAADDAWLPKGLSEHLLWPFIISADSRRVGQLPLRHWLWALVLAALIARVAIGALRWRRGTAGAIEARGRPVVLVVVIGFVVWMETFSIYRYLVPVELLAPLAIFVLLKETFDYPVAKRIAAWSLGVVTIALVCGGFKTWGHASWGEQTYDVQVPELPDASRTTVLLVGGDPPWAWIATAFPREVAFAQIGGNFPEGPDFKPRIRAMALDPGRAAWAVIAGHRDSEAERGAGVTRLAGAIGLTRTAWGCATLEGIARTLRSRMSVVSAKPGDGQPLCAIEFLSRAPTRDIEAENRSERGHARIILEAYGFGLDEGTCDLRQARLGASAKMFQWCRLRTLDASQRR